MNNEKFLNQEIINKNNERGLVTFFDDDHIVIKYPNCDKIYCPEIAFKNDFLAFLDNSLNLLIKKDLTIKENLRLQHQKEAEENYLISVEKQKEIYKAYREIDAKNDFLLSLFGEDFEYPPYIEFVKKNRRYFSDETATFGFRSF